MDYKIKYNMFKNLSTNNSIQNCYFQSVIGKFVDTEHLLSLCVQIPKEENVRNCEQKIANVICLKHALELVKPLRDCLSTCTNPLFQTYHQVSNLSYFKIVLHFSVQVWLEPSIHLFIHFILHTLTTQILFGMRISYLRF